MRRAERTPVRKNWHQTIWEVRRRFLSMHEFLYDIERVVRKIIIIIIIIDITCWYLTDTCKCHLKPLITR